MDDESGGDDSDGLTSGWGGESRQDWWGWRITPSVVEIPWYSFIIVSLINFIIGKRYILNAPLLRSQILSVHL